MVGEVVRPANLDTAICAVCAEPTQSTQFNNGLHAPCNYIARQKQDSKEKCPVKAPAYSMAHKNAFSP